jgi:hypothetical protein
VIVTLHLLIKDLMEVSMTTQTLLTVPDLVFALEPLIGQTVPVARLFALIAAGQVKPLGYVARAPVFSLSQVADVANAVAEALRSPAETEVR